MKLKNIMLVTLLLLAVLSISAVSANDNNITDNGEVLEDTSDKIKISDDYVVSSAQESDNGTFADLKNKIDSAEEGSTVSLANNYTYEDGFNIEGIEITKSITIDGKGYTINGNSQARAFNLNGGVITIKNLTIINCWAQYGGGAIYNYVGPNCTIDSCTFTNCYSEIYGGAISNNGNAYMKVISCNFNKCSADEYGGAIENNGDGAHFAVISCNFTDCHVKQRGGAITNLCYNFTVDSCNFNNCSTIVGKAGFAGAIENRCTDLNVNSCNFTDCFAQYGGAIYNYDVAKYCYITSCNFNNCSSNYGGAINNYGENVTCNITSCNFIDCTATMSGAAIYNTGSNVTALNSKFTNVNETEAGYNVEFIKCSFNYTPSTVLTVSNVTATYGVSNKLTVTLKDANGNVLSNQKVTVNVGSISQTLTTDSSGQASVDVSGLVPKTYTAYIKFEGDESYAASNQSASVTVKKATSKIIATTITAIYNAGKYLTITLEDSQGKAISGAAITINLNGAKKLTTDEKGQVKISTNKLVPNTYTAKITFAGNTNYLSSAKSVKVTVKKATPKITANSKSFKKSTKTKKYKIALKNNLNKAMKNTKVTIKVNKKTYAAKTNTKGVAVFKITKLTKKGTFKSTITYKGSNYYNKVTKKVNIKIK